MARPEKNNVEFFPHYSDHGKKMYYIRDKFGNDGYAVWFMLLEQLGKANYHYLKLDNEIDLLFLSNDFKVDENTLISIINILVKFGEFDAELWEQYKVIYAPKFIESLRPLYEKRRKNPLTKNDLLTLLSNLGNGNEVINPDNEDNNNDNPQSKVKYSKVKESKTYKGEKATTLLANARIVFEVLNHANISYSQSSVLEFLKEKKCEFVAQVFEYKTSGRNGIKKIDSLLNNFLKYSEQYEKSKTKNKEHGAVLAIYKKWFKKEFQETPKISLRDHGELKEIINWLKANENTKNDILGAWSAVLNSWNLLDSFHQSRTSITQISTDWNTIISKLSNPKKSTNKKSNHPSDDEVDAQIIANMKAFGGAKS